MTRFDSLKKLPRHKWFSAASPDDERWFGPWPTLEEAAFECFATDPDARDDRTCYVAQGYKMTKAEQAELGVDFEWQVDSRESITIKLP